MSSTYVSKRECDDVLTTNLIDLVADAKSAKHVARGAEEVTKAVQAGTAELIIVGNQAQCSKQLEETCKKNNIPYAVVFSRSDPGARLGVNSTVYAVTKGSAGGLAARIQTLRGALKKKG